MDQNRTTHVTHAGEADPGSARWHWSGSPPELSSCRNADQETDAEDLAAHARAKLARDGLCWACYRGYGTTKAQHRDSGGK